MLLKFAKLFDSERRQIYMRQCALRLRMDFGHIADGPNHKGDTVTHLGQHG